MLDPRYLKVKEKDSIEVKLSIIMLTMLPNHLLQNILVTFKYVATTEETI